MHILDFWTDNIYYIVKDLLYKNSKIITMITWITIALTLTTIFNFFIMRKWRDRWVNQGILTAFFISLFVEMFGMVITIYSLSTLWQITIFNNYITSNGFYIFTKDPELYCSSLSDPMINYVLHIGIYIPFILCPIGIFIICFGWTQVYRAVKRNTLCTTKLYKYIRHPQYLGFIIFLLGFNLYFPLLISWLIFPYFIILYYLLARKEENDLFKKLGAEYIKYQRKTKMFIPKVV